MGRTGNFDKDCLYSTVKNTSGVTKRFGFLPPHGVQLAAGEELTVFGNILESISNSPDRGGRRNQIAFAAAIDRLDLDIISTPAPILEDLDTGANKMLQLDGGTLSAVDPCWETSDSADVAIPA